MNGDIFASEIHGTGPTGTWKRSFKKSYFYRVMANGETVKREWLIYGGTTGSVYYYICKLFTKTKTAISLHGIKDWKNINARLLEHENSSGHKNALCCALFRSKTEGRIDEKLASQTNCGNGNIFFN